MLIWYIFDLCYLIVYQEIEIDEQPLQEANLKVGGPFIQLMLSPLADLSIHPYEILISFIRLSGNVIQQIQEACSSGAAVESHQIGDEARNAKQSHLAESQGNSTHLSIFPAVTR